MTTWPALPPSDQGVYSISVASELTGIEPQTLRLYEDKGLVEPGRTDGGTRRYSEEDVQRIRRIAELTAAGLNLAGIGLVFELEAENDWLRAKLDRAPPDDAAADG